MSIWKQGQDREELDRVRATVGSGNPLFVVVELSPQSYVAIETYQSETLIMKFLKYSFPMLTRRAQKYS
ncbi:hypothetical protein DH86_00001276 [Scytalidium sp. 3C]|nr:hypothetical protein DH86_00001276 [Scytalidium sp. 3C]